MRNLLILLTLLLWLVLGWKMCNDYHTCCGQEVASTIPPVPQQEKQAKECLEIICFERHSCEPNFSATWTPYRDSLIQAIGPNQKLIITGLYGTSERNDSNSDNLGLCRADAIKTRMQDQIGSKLTEILGQLRVGSGSGADDYSQDRISFSIVDVAEEIRTTSLIYFPYNSTDRLQESSIEAYLKQVATRIISSGERVRLIGHTDNLGRESYNLQLGQKRAQIVRDFLIEYGASSSQIITESMGESKPVASNDTDSGRAQNRRTELEIIK